MGISGQIYAAATLSPPPPPGKELRHPLNRKLGETHNRTANFGEEINLSPVSRINHNSADVQNVVSNPTD